MGRISNRQPWRLSSSDGEDPSGGQGVLCTAGGGEMEILGLDSNHYHRPFPWLWSMEPKNSVPKGPWIWGINCVTGLGLFRQESMGSGLQTPHLSEKLRKSTSRSRTSCTST